MRKRRVAEAGTSNMERGTGNLEPGTGNMWNAELGTWNREPATADSQALRLSGFRFAAVRVRDQSAAPRG
jgi:hypothetical protein